MQAVQEIFANQPQARYPGAASATDLGEYREPRRSRSGSTGGIRAQSGRDTVPDPTDSGTPATVTSDGIAKAAPHLLEAGLTFLESLGSGDAGRHGDGVDGATTQFPFLLGFSRETDKPIARFCRFRCQLLSPRSGWDEHSPAW